MKIMITTTIRIAIIACFSAQIRQQHHLFVNQLVVWC